MSELTPEDSLRLNVMLAGEIQAIRIDATNMTIYGLSPRGTASVKLHPSGRSEQYLRTARELLAGFAIGSPGGYPVYLQRWTRMGQARDKGLDRLLLLGEPEAVTSVAYSNGLTDELARRAWWAMPVADHARRMLERECVVKGQMGKVLADYLIEHLPFENSAHIIMDTIRILLQPGLTDEQTRLSLWRKGEIDNAYHAGFLASVPDALPEQLPPRDDFESLKPRLADLGAQGNIFARQLQRILSAPGQTFFHAYDELLRSPADKDVVLVLLDALATYFDVLRQQHVCSGETVEEIISSVELFVAGQETASPVSQLLQAMPQLNDEVRAMLALSCIDIDIATPIMSQTTASGSLMRKKLEPVTTPMLQLISALTGKTFSASTSRRRSR
ncbi:MAG TPA: hypothetical protein VMV48_15735 [Gallionellaceae bacterium]|nr:hypothetical protein [Gallionellaceae bacterium]